MKLPYKKTKPFKTGEYMNFKKTALAFIVGVVATVFGVPTNASAASSSTQTKIAVLNAKLKSIPNGTGKYQTIKSLVTKLAKLDPKKAATYYKTGLKKNTSNPSQQSQAKQLGNQVTKIVNKSGLPASQIKKITKTVTKDIKTVPPYVPPYQASLSSIEGYAIA